MATKKKATRKKKAIVKINFPTSRELTLDRLTREGACFSSRLAFVNAFQTFGSTLITEERVASLTDAQVMQLGRPSSGYLVSSEGRSKFYRSVAAQRLDSDRGTAATRKYLVTLARHFIRYPKQIGA